jgi:hypothetical protein
MKGACHGIDILRPSRWLTAIDTGVVRFQWTPLPVVDRWTIGFFRHRLPVVLTWHDSKPY